MAQAEVRAAADSLEVGDFVSWEFSNGRSQGRITRIVTDGQIEVPDSSFTINGTADDPAVLIRIYDEEGETDRLVGHRATTLTKIDPLPESDEEDDAERELPAAEEERETKIVVKVSADTTDFVAKIASLKSAILSTPLHGK